jgi:hypothetical protein
LATVDLINDPNLIQFLSSNNIEVASAATNALAKSSTFLEYCGAFAIWGIVCLLVARITSS